MACDVIRLDAMDWTPGGHPLERKKGPRGNVVLLEFAPGFSDPSWCVRSHVIYVVRGTLELELEGGVERVDAGQAVSLPAGTAHRARNPGQDVAELFVVSDV
jgi:quercetin dioxygenase-like cupin family protein